MRPPFCGGGFKADVIFSNDGAKVFGVLSSRFEFLRHADGLKIGVMGLREHSGSGREAWADIQRKDAVCDKAFVGADMGCS